MSVVPVILVIEAHAETREMLRVALEAEKYQVFEADNAHTALKIAAENKIDLILQDFILPDMDAPELNRALRAMEHLATVPMLGLSGFLNRCEEVRTTGLGFTGYLLKPIVATYLVKVVASYLVPIQGMIEQLWQGKQVLLVDDSITQLKLAQAQLVQAGFIVETASDGREALQKIRAQAFDIVVSDVLMAEMDGFQLCLEIRRDQKLRHIPVILMTSHYVEEPDRKLARKVAANHYLTRSQDITPLLAAMSDCFHAQGEAPQLESLERFKEEHFARILRQLDLQVATNLSLAQRCALQAGQLSLLKGVTDILAGHTITEALKDVLVTCLDVAGISKGAFYLLDKARQPLLKQCIGYAEADQDYLNDFFSESDLLNKVLINKTILKIPGADIHARITQKILEQADITSALLVPLISGGACFGALLLGSKVTNLADEISLDFARALGLQLGQMIMVSQAFERIVVSEERYRGIMDNASCIIFAHDENGKILEVNKQGELLLGCSKEEILGKNLVSFVILADQAAVVEKIKQVVQDKYFSVSEVKIKDAKEHLHTVEFTGVKLNTKTEDFWLLIANDVTERNQLRIQAQLQDKLASVGTLAAGIAHEINHPMAWVLANLGFIKEHLSEVQESIDKLCKVIDQQPIGNDSLVQDCLNEVKKYQNVFKLTEIIDESIEGAERVRDIVRSLRGFARVDESEAKSIDIHDVINSAINMSYQEIKIRARLEKDFASDLPRLYLHSGKLHQVFLNLLINAAQAIPEGKSNQNKIKLCTKLVKDYIQIEVIDTGPGIPEDILPKIFEPFFTTKPVGTGTGLGLSICHEIIKQLGGEISVDSKLGQGTKFTILLPLPVTAPESKCEQKPDLLSRVQKEVLLVDDEPLMLKSLQRLLETRHKVTSALGGKAACQLLKEQQEQYDVILCDLNMPELNGVELYQFIAKQYPGLEQKMIFMTGGTYAKLYSNFIATVKNLRLEKPFSLEDLLLAIDKTGSL